MILSLNAKTLGVGYSLSEYFNKGNL